MMYYHCTTMLILCKLININICLFFKSCYFKFLFQSKKTLSIKLSVFLLINKDGNYNAVPSFVLEIYFFYIVTINVDMV